MKDYEGRREEIDKERKSKRGEYDVIRKICKGRRRSEEENQQRRSGIKKNEGESEERNNQRD